MKRITGIAEWADASASIQIGCEHDCKYGFCKAAAVRFGRVVPEEWKAPVYKDKLPKVPMKTGTLMFPNNHDITPANVERCISFLIGVMESRSCKVLIVSKPGLDVVRRLMSALEKYKDRILFRFTIGSPDNTVLKFWEPGAPDYKERVACLSLAYSQGWATSVSCEPMLDFPYQMEKIIDELSQFVTDAIWLGLMNKSALRLKMNGHEKAIKQHGVLMTAWTDATVKAFYEKHKNNPKVKWKDSVKAIVGLPSNEMAGMDK